MPDNFQSLNHTKERIISIITAKGPSLPVQIARTINVSPMFASVFLSELYNDNKLKMSNMKVGSSSLYYIRGQEQQLENFIEHLNQKEKEAFLLLRDKRVLEDEKQVPAIRVALRSLKDFAIPLKIKEDEQEKFVWKYFLLPDEDFEKLVRKANHQRPEKKREQEVLQEIKEQKPEIKPKIKIEPIVQPQPATQQIELPKPKEKKVKLKEYPFQLKVQEYLSSKQIELLELSESKSKEFAAKIQVDARFGKQEFYLLAKDKKKLSDVDLTMALQKAQNEKMPALVLSTGDLDKKAQEYIKSWKNLIKFEKLSF